MDQLTVCDHMMLELEGSWWKYAGAKDTTTRWLFAMGATRYYQVLNHLIDQPAAEAAYPMTVRRLRRLRNQRQAQRSARRRGLA